MITVLWFYKPIYIINSLQHVRISLSTKFHLKQTILISWTQFAQKWYSGLEQKKLTPPSNSAYSV